MGDRDAKCYLASPEVVAYSALAGKICGGGMAEAPTGEVGSIERADPKAAAGAVEILDGFPRKMESEALLLDADNLNTDGIYSKDWTYKDGLSPDEMASHAMKNYDPEFRSIAKSGDLLLSGYNFGTGSSREQAATCLMYFGIKVVLAASFSETYKRNAFNNGFLCVDCRNSSMTCAAQTRRRPRPPSARAKHSPWTF
ncbi:MAG: homoaconitate hydratase [Candidatus Paceibacteria bacterium]|jgi:homoaconitate hydratase